MATADPAPTPSWKVMISSSFSDLKEHRKALIEAVNKTDNKAEAMEFHDGAVAGDVLDSSLEMVRNSAGYVGVVSLRYGQIPDDPERNPEGLSLTELEYREAVRLRRPCLIFIMGEDHLVRKADVETDPDKQKKLEAFREFAKLPNQETKVHRVWIGFESLEEFREKAPEAAAKMERHLREHGPTVAASSPATSTPTATGMKELVAMPPYIGSHEFLGRAEELGRLDDWARASDSHSVLLFEAIGGMGKSLLTWTWVKNNSLQVRDDWAGRFWYSFYEKQAAMGSFCRYALAYMEGRPVEEFEKLDSDELREKLLVHLRARPWLLVLDGLERILVAYHRLDAAELSDEAANQPTDAMAQRDPCAAIRPEDDELLRELAGAGPSKVLITSRLTPKVLLNQSRQGIPGVRRRTLEGLLPADAEQMLRNCEIEGDSAKIQDFLGRHCDGHPLVIGALAGLVRDYRPKRGHFDSWAEDPAAGGKLDLASLDLVPKRNHILIDAIQVVSEDGRVVLSTMALLPWGVDWEALRALCKEVEDLDAALKDLEWRGLLQYSKDSGRYDLHPVVRGVAAGTVKGKERDLHGQGIVDYFQAQPHRPYDEAERWEDVQDGVTIVRALMQMERWQEAADVYLRGLSGAMLFNVNARDEALSLLQRFFPDGWTTFREGVNRSDLASLANSAGMCLRWIGQIADAEAAFGIALAEGLRARNWGVARTGLSNLSVLLAQRGCRANSETLAGLSLDFAEAAKNVESVFRARLDLYQLCVQRGKWVEAEGYWRQLDPMGRAWSRAICRPGDPERALAWGRFYHGTLSGGQLLRAEQLCQEGKNGAAAVDLGTLRGHWHRSRGEWAEAEKSYAELVQILRAARQTSRAAESWVALAEWHQGKVKTARLEAERLSKSSGGDPHALGSLFLELGDLDRAEEFALKAYRWAWGEGEPYVHRYWLEEAKALLKRLGVAAPVLPPYDPSKEKPYPWEAEIRAWIEELRAKQKKRKSKKTRRQG